MKVAPQQLYDGLVSRGLPDFIAKAIVGNTGAESDFNTSINEKAPLVPGSRGGFGLEQWTGPRRTALEDFATQRGTSPSDLNTQLDFMMWEGQGPEKKAWNALLAAPDEATAAKVFENQYLRPGIPHGANALGTAGLVSPQAPQTAQNALTGYAPRLNFNALQLQNYRMT